MKTIYLSIIMVFISVNAISQSIPPADSCALYVNGKTHYYGVWPGCNSTYTSCNNGCLYKPVILLNGFDPDSHRHLYAPDDDCLTDEGLTYEKCIYCVANEHGMAESLRSAGYDIVILDFADLDVIRKQADVLQALIIELKQKMQECDNQHEFVVIGPSSGGLVARYALAEMEGNDIDHNTRLYISFDAPHQGANVPLSMQYLIYEIRDKISIEIVDLMFDILNSLQTRELLIYHFNSTINSNAYASSEFDNLYTRINSLNGVGYPIQSRNVAISNGSSVSNNQGFNSGDRLFRITLPYVLLNYFYNGFALNNHQNSKVYSELIIQPILFFGTSYVEKKISNSSSLDNAPGGRGNFIAQLIDNVNDKMSWLVGANCIANDCDDQFECFIPTISSLDLKNTDDYFYNVKANITGNDDLAFKGIDYNGDVSPFDAMCISEENEWHVINGVTDLIAGFVEDEIMPGQYFLQNQLIAKCTDYSSLDYIKMGKNVTDRKPHGEFVFSANSGVSDVVARNRVVMEPGSKLRPIGCGKIHLYTQAFSNCGFVSNRSFQEVPGIRQSVNSNIDSDIIKAGIEDDYISVYPNPFNDRLILEIDAAFGKEIHIKLIDIQGSVVLSEVSHISQQNGFFTKVISTASLQSGAYILFISSESNLESVKVIK
jgi:hypothetical protein